MITPSATWLEGTDDDVMELAKPRLDEPAVVAALAAPPLDLSDEGKFRAQQQLTAPLGYAKWNEATYAHSQTGSTDVAALRAYFGSQPPVALVEAIRSLDVPVHIIGGGVDLLSGRQPVLDLESVFTDDSN